MINIATRLLTNLRQAIAAYADQQNRAQNLVWLGATAYSPIIPPNAPSRLPAETWGLLYNRLNRMAARFTALFHRWRTGTLLAPRPSRASKPYTSRPIPRLPAKRGWVNHRIPASAACTGQLEALLQDPELPEFLAQAPQAGRLLRPLCHALGLPEPAWLALPRRPARLFSPHALGRGEPEGGSSTSPPPPDLTSPPTPDRPIPRNILAAARAWKKYDR